MARPIEATPVLKGCDAINFIQSAQSPTPYTPPSFDMKKMQAKAKELAKRRASK